MSKVLNTDASNINARRKNRSLTKLNAIALNADFKVSALVDQ
jgi:hypothetical protein